MSSRGPLLVAVVGIDGSGKTTLARGLAQRLRSAGECARYFENAGGRPLMNIVARRRGHVDAVAWLGMERYQLIEQRFRALLIWRSLAWSRLPSYRRRIAVMDRYALCQYAACRARSADGEQRMRQRYARFPEPDLVLFLDVDPAVAQRRVEARGRDHEDLAWLQEYDGAYRSLPEWPGLIVVDANRPAPEVLEDVMARVLAHS